MGDGRGAIRGSILVSDCGQPVEEIKMADANKPEAFAGFTTDDLKEWLERHANATMPSGMLYRMGWLIGEVERLTAENAALMTEMQAVYDLAQRFLDYDSRCSKEPLHLVAKINAIAEKRAFRKFALHSAAEAVRG